MIARLALICVVLGATLVHALAQGVRFGSPVQRQSIDSSSIDYSRDKQISRTLQRVPTVGRPELTGGAADISVPLPLPPQIGSSGLDLSLTYSSHSNSDIAGRGWQISELPSIHRCALPFKNDKKGLITHKRDDHYCLNGTLLILVQGIQGQPGSIYRSEIDDFQRVTAVGAHSDSGPESFLLHDPSGRLIELGSSSDSRTEWTARNSVRSWHPSKTEDTNGNTIIFKYDNDPDADTPRLREIEYASNPKIAATARYVVKFSYEGRPDPTTFYSEGKLFKNTHRLKQIEVASKTTQLRRYILTYEQSAATARSLLTSIQECDALATCLKPILFSWSASGPSTAPLGPQQSSAGVHGLGAQRWFIDINGDGLLDYVVKTNDGNLHWNINMGTGWGPKQTQSGLHALANDRWLFDINGDGLPDYVAKTADGNIHWNLNRGSGYDAANAFGPSQTQGGVHGLGDARWLVDINGDGLPDYVVKTNDGNIHWNLNTGTGWGPNQTQLGVHSLGADRWLADINGDGLPDYVAKTADGNIHWNLNKGSGFATASAFASNQSQGGVHGLGVMRWLVDINGDGLPDYVAKNNDGNLHWNINTGSGWAPSQTQGGLHGPGADRWFVDINGDGLPDYVAKNNDGNIHFNLNRGIGYDGNNAFASPQTQAGMHGLGAARWMVDINGDGLLDYVVKNEDALIHFDLSLLKRPDLLISVTNSYGTRVAFEYQPLIGRRSPTGPEAHPLHHPNEDRPLVAKKRTMGTTANSAQEIVYTYTGAKVDVHRRQSMGFERIEAKDADSGLITEIIYHQQFPLHGRPQSIIFRTASGTVLRREQITWDTQTEQGVTRVLEKSRQSSAYDLIGTLISTSLLTSAYDQYGNVVSEVLKDRLDNIFTRTTTFAPLSDKWILRLPTRIEERRNDRNRGVTEVISTFQYDNLGRRTKETSLADTDTVWEKVFEYNPRGLLLSESMTAAGQPARRTEYDYDEFGQRVAVKNALGHIVRFAYSEATGQVTRREDPNRHATAFVYDNFGRLIRMDLPSGDVLNLDYKVGVGEAALAITLRRNELTDLIEEYDDQGHLLRVSGKNGDAKDFQQVFEYDRYGRLARRSNRHFLGSTGSWTSFEYDLLGRLTRRVNPDGRSRALSYDGLRTTVTDELGNRMERQMDERGNITVVTEPEGIQSQFTWDMRGNLIAVEGPENYKATLSYDDRGRLSQVAEPHAGLRGFVWTAFEELQKETSGATISINWTYDPLGRPLALSSPTRKANWTYDLGLAGLGKVSKIETEVYSDEFTYDAATGRVVEQTRTVDSARLTVSRAYDSAGRLKRLTYPGGLIVEYMYNMDGSPNAVRVPSDGVTIWQALTYDAAGRVVRERLGNGVTTDRSFDPQEQRPEKIVTTDLRGRRLSDWRYDYDALGNLTRISDSGGRVLRENFFDRLNRLTRVTDSLSGAIHSFQYSPSGNLLSRNANERFFYGNESYGPHAPTRRRHDNRTTAFQYDARGNLISDGFRSFTYNDRGLLAKAKQDGVEFEFDYDDSGDRVRVNRISQGSRETILYFGDLFKKTGLGTTTISRSVIGVGGAIVAIYVEIQSPDTPTTGEFVYPHVDQANSVRMITDRDGELLATIDYGPFGEPVVDIKRDKLGIGNWIYDRTFTGLELDHKLGIINAKSRLLDANTGRFLGPDPVFIAGAGSQDLNRYAYASNNPIRYTDRTGLAREYSVLGESARADRDRFFREKRDWADRQLDRMRVEREMREGRFNFRERLDRMPRLEAPKLGDSALRNREPHYTLFPRTPAMPRGESIDKNIARVQDNKKSFAQRFEDWYQSVKSGGEWDYKTQGKDWQDLGNFNFGTTGAALGLPDEVLLRGAGWYQEFKTPKAYDSSYGHSYNPFSESRGDDPKDQWQIRQGIDYYRHRELIRWLEGNSSAGAQ